MTWTNLSPTKSLALSLTLAAATLASAACITASNAGPTASDRTDFGHIAVVADPPAVNTQVVDKFDFHIEDRRISESQPGNSLNFAWSLEPDGCIRGQALSKVCPAPALVGDEPGTQRWRDTSGQRTFTTELSADGSKLTVEDGRHRGIYLLGDGAAVDEVRREPWMLGIALLHHAAPAAEPKGEGSSLDYHFKVLAER